MLIRYQDRRLVDYAVFALKTPYYDGVETLKSSVSWTNLSGNAPAIMTITLENGTILSTKKFIVTNQYNSEFRILDRQLYEVIAKMAEKREHCSAILDVLLLCSDNYPNVWAIIIYFDNSLDDYTDNYECFGVTDVSWDIKEAK